MKYFLLLLFISSAAWAEEHPLMKCTRTDGSVLYTNLPCDGRAEMITSRPITIIQHESPPLAASSTTFISGALAMYVVMSVLVYLLYAEDKRRSIRGDWRVPEKLLHMAELLGGWPGAWLAQKRVRHKNKKSAYQIVFWLIVMLHLGFWVNYAAGNLLWDKLSGKASADISQGALEKVLNNYGLDNAKGEDLAKQLSDIQKALEEQQKKNKEEGIE